MIALLVMTDGRRDCVTRCVPSALASLRGPITHRIIHDDSGRSSYRDWLRKAFPTFDVIHPGGRRQGFGGAIRQAWAHLNTLPVDFVFHLEDDFVFNEEIDLAAMVDVLGHNPDLVQMVLKRQPWSTSEVEAGGVIEQHPEDYVQVVDGDYTWLRHKKFFSTNPSLYRKTLLEEGWPSGDRSEGVFTHTLLAGNPDRSFGYWGARVDAPKVEHIGRQRVGTGY